MYCTLDVNRSWIVHYLSNKMYNITHWSSFSINSNLFAICASNTTIFWTALICEFGWPLALTLTKVLTSFFFFGEKCSAPTRIQTSILWLLCGYSSKWATKAFWNKILYIWTVLNIVSASLQRCMFGTAPKQDMPVPTDSALYLI